MSSFVFNNFKNRFSKGQVNSADTWYFIPVNSSFKETFDLSSLPLQQYRTLSDFTKINESALNVSDNNISGSSLLSADSITRTYLKPLVDEYQNKPMFVTKDNFENFEQYYKDRILSNKNIQSYLDNGGFYFVRSTDEYEWIANHTNTQNNSIIIVLGDNIEGKAFQNKIGADEKYPFNGIFDGNNYQIKNCSIICNNTDNGIIGVLGKTGIVRNLFINFSDNEENTHNSLLCTKKINLKHIKEDARDINAGFLVGRNYGTIENIGIAKSQFNVYGFIPEVYSVTNKSDNYTWNDEKVRSKFDENTENYYLLNSYCINSPGNICPYIGYFAEGMYSEDKWALTRVFRTNVNVPITGGLGLPVLRRIGTYDTITEDYSQNSNYSAFNNLKANTKENLTSSFLNLSINKYGAVNTFTTSGLSEAKKDQNLPILTLNENNDLTDFNYYLMNNAFGGEQQYEYEYKTIANTNLPITGYEMIYQNTFYDISAIKDNKDKIKENILNLSKLPLYYGVDYKGFYTCGALNGQRDFTLTAKDVYSAGNCDYRYSYNNAVLCYNTNIIQDSVGIDDNTNVPSIYNYASMRLHPIARAAYNVGVLVGSNYGNIINVKVNNVTIHNTSNFVGFLGGLVGKQNYGNISSCDIRETNNFDWEPSAGSKVIYKNTPILPQSLRKSFNGYLASAGQYGAELYYMVQDKNKNWMINSGNLTLASAYEKLSTADVKYSADYKKILSGMFNKYDDKYYSWNITPSANLPLTLSSNEYNESLLNVVTTNSGIILNKLKNLNINKDIQEIEYGRWSASFENFKNSLDYITITPYSSTSSNDLDLYFSAFYEDKIDEYAVTDDCVEYETKPIIVAGGLFGRVVPTVNQIMDVNTHTMVNDTIAVIDTTNYSYLNNYNVRLENEFGVLAGKCDWSFIANNYIPTTTDVNVDKYIWVNNSVLSANKNNYFRHNFSITTATDGGYIHQMTPSTANEDLLPLIGVYELKNNVIDSVTIDDYQLNEFFFKTGEFKYPIDDDKNIKKDTFTERRDIYSGVFDNQYKNGPETRYLYTNDYPILTNSSPQPGDVVSRYKNNATLKSVLTLTDPNLFKTNIATNILSTYNVSSNVKDVIFLYQNMKTTYDGFWYTSNEYGDYQLGGTSPVPLNGITNGAKFYVYNNQGDYTDFPIQSIADPNDITDYLDGYTTITYKNAPPAYFPTITDVGGIHPDTYYGTFLLTLPSDWSISSGRKSRLTYGMEYYDIDSNKYVNPRTYEKNILQLAGSRFSSISAIGTIPKISIKSSSKQNKTDKYFFYTYEDKNKNNYIPNLLPYDYTNSDIVKKCDVKFDNKEFTEYFAIECETCSGKGNIIENDEAKECTACNGNGYIVSSYNKKNYGYYTSAQDINCIGDLFEPSAIRQKIRESTNQSGFDTTNIITDEELGGFLIVDSNQNNVMFLDNTNNLPLNGNNIYLGFTKTIDNNFKILEIE